MTYEWNIKTLGKNLIINFSSEYASYFLTDCIYMFLVQSLVILVYSGLFSSETDSGL